MEQIRLTIPYHNPEAALFDRSLASLCRQSYRQMALAGGNFISFTDSDDLVHPAFLESLHRPAKETGALVTVCDLRAAGEILETSLVSSARRSWRSGSPSVPVGACVI